MKEILNEIKEDKHWFCPLPFNHIYSNSSGEYAPCCLGRPQVISKDPLTFCNTGNTSILDWWNGEVMNNIRNEMLGITDSTEYCDHFCGRCKLQEKQQGSSTRQKWVKSLLIDSDNSVKNQNTILSAAEYKDTGNMILEKFQGRYLDIKLRIFGNLCNLSCYMCWPHNSTTRINDINKLDDKWKNEWLKPNIKSISKVDELAFSKSIKQIKEVAHLISSIKITGGEPMMMDNHYRLLDMLIETGNSKHINLKYQTNFTKFSRGKENFFKYIKQFRYVYLHISVDSYGEYDEYIRKNGNQQVVDDNLESIKNISNVSVGLACTISMLSVLRYSDYKKKYSKFPIASFVLTGPDYLNIKHLPQPLKNKLIKELQLNLHLKKDDQQIINMLKQPRDEKQFQKGLQYCLDLDMLYRRNKGLFDLWPELEEYYVST